MFGEGSSNDNSGREGDNNNFNSGKERRDSDVEVGREPFSKRVVY